MDYFVSIVILSFDPPARLFNELKAQTYKNFEVLVAREKGIVNAMNRALERARGDIFVRIDDDVKLPPNWLLELIRPFKDDIVGGVTGPTFVPENRRSFRDSIRWAENPTGVLKWLYDDNKFNPAGIRECGVVSYDSNFEERIVDNFKYVYTVISPDHLEGTNWAVRTDLIRKVGGFDPKFDGVAEWFDDDVVFKIKAKGYRLFYNPNAYLYHLLGKGGHYQDRFEGFGRIKNFLRFHWIHCRWRFKKIKFWCYLIIWSAYFVWKNFQKSR